MDQTKATSLECMVVECSETETLSLKAYKRREVSVVSVHPWEATKCVNSTHDRIHRRIDVASTLLTL